MASAEFKIRVNGGPLTTTAEVVAGDVISFHATSFAGWQSGRWEMPAFPPGFPAPSGWSTDGSNGRYYYLANSVGGMNPPNVTMPNSAGILGGQWGKWLFDLTVNNTIKASSRCGVNIVSPNLGLKGKGFSERTEFGGVTRAFVGDEQHDAQLVDAAALTPGAVPTTRVLTAGTGLTGGGDLSADRTFNVVGNADGSIIANANDVQLGALGFARVQTALALASGAVSFNSQEITGVATPTASTSAATKGYVDSVAVGLDTKASVRAATTANITLSGAQTIDSVSVIATNRVLVKNQSTGSENGFYVAAAGAWARSTDMAAGSSAAGSYCFVEEGGQADTGWVCTSNVGADVVGTNSLAFSQFTSASSYTAGDGLTESPALTFNVAAANGTIIVNANSIQVGEIANANVEAAAAIAGSKINPDFGAQNVTTTGSYTAGANGFIGVKLDTATGVALTIGGNATSTLLVQPTTITVTDAVTNTTTEAFALEHMTSGTAAANFGLTAQIRLENAAGTKRDACSLRWHWDTATNAAESCEFGIYMMANGSMSTRRFWLEYSSFFSATNPNASMWLAGSEGYRFEDSNNRGGIRSTFARDYAIAIEAWNDKRIVFVLDGDSGGSGGIERVVYLPTGGLTHWLAAGARIIIQHGATAGERFTLTQSADVSTSNDTPVDALSYTELTQSFVGKVLLEAEIADVTNGDRAIYERRYEIRQHNGAGVTVAEIGTPIEVESDAGWNASVTTSGGHLYGTVRGDSTNQTKGQVKWTINIRTYTAS